MTTTGKPAHIHLDLAILMIVAMVKYPVCIPGASHTLRMCLVPERTTMELLHSCFMTKHWNLMALGANILSIFRIMSFDKKNRTRQLPSFFIPWILRARYERPFLLPFTSTHAPPPESTPDPATSTSTVSSNERIWRPTPSPCSPNQIR
jgi:hypothetical protein